MITYVIIRRHVDRDKTPTKVWSGVFRHLFRDVFRSGRSCGAGHTRTRSSAHAQRLTQRSPDVPDALNFSYLLLDVGRLFLKRYARRAAAFGFTLPQSKALGHLARNEGISQARLAELCDLEPMAMARIVERMETDGWVKRNRDTRDRRSNRLYVTAEGERILDRMKTISADLRAQIIAGVPREDRAVFMRVLEHLFTALLVMDGAPCGSDDSEGS